MARNKIFDSGSRLSLVCSHPTTPVTGGPVRVGEMVGVALTNERTDGTTSVDFRGVFDLSVKGVDGSGNSAVAVGDKIYYTDADTPVLNKKATGRFIGWALEAIASAGTDTIRVRLGS